MQPMAKWPASASSALPVADAVSSEFDGINVTSQHVMRLLVFYHQFIEDYRGSQVLAH